MKKASGEDEDAKDIDSDEAIISAISERYGSGRKSDGKEQEDPKSNSRDAWGISLTEADKYRSESSDDGDKAKIGASTSVTAPLVGSISEVSPSPTELERRANYRSDTPGAVQVPGHLARGSSVSTVQVGGEEDTSASLPEKHLLSAVTVDAEEEVQEASSRQLQPPKVVAAVPMSEDDNQRSILDALTDKRVACVLFVVVALVVGLTAALTIIFTQNDASGPVSVEVPDSPSQTTSPISGPTDPPTKLPTSFPSVGPTKAPVTLKPTVVGETYSPTPRPTALPTIEEYPLFDLWVDILEYYVDDIYDYVDDEDSPQYKALDWLANVDEWSNEDREYDVEMLVERYALTAIFYATDGENWKNNLDFLSPDLGVCDWRDYIVFSEDFEFWEGVTCDGDGFVEEFSICTFVVMKTIALQSLVHFLLIIFSFFLQKQKLIIRLLD